jgi:hypothetical protein
MATKLIFEQLEEINKDISLLETKYKQSSALKLIFAHAFKEEKKFLLPETNPPYREDKHPIGMAPTTLTHECRRLYVFCREDLNKMKRESLFIDLLESVDPKEAKVLLAIKDQKLTKMYPKITKKKIEEAGFL